MSQTPKILDGKWLAGQYHNVIRAEVEALKAKKGRVPGLGVILVGDNPASKAYVGNKEKVAKKQCGFETFDIFLPADASASDVAKAISTYNSQATVDGILLQLPLPKHLDEKPLLDSILPHKDADGLHPHNQGLMQRGDGRLQSCTPLGCMKLIDLAFSNHDPSDGTSLSAELPEVDLSGKSAVVIGRSILVGKPVAAMLLDRNATVTIAHSRTTNLAEVVKSADIVVAAVGRPLMVKGDWIKPGAVVIDVGINRVESGALVGDVDYEEAAKRASAITPVPGGVGPMTVAMLMYNTLQAYKS
jgi:methylenetetrahydrofolate dehydrogenase (NADP+) / methenyltetrahydrofolate cyclohydrolase